MALNSDSQGFLLGSPLNQNDLIDEVRALLEVARAIRKTVRDRFDMDAPAAPPKVLSVELPEAASTTPVPVRRTEVAQPVAARRARPEVVQAVRPVAEPVTRSRSRDMRDDDDSPHLIPGLAVPGRVANASAEVAKTVVNEDVDPTVKAFNEVAEPLKRGWSALRGGDTGKRQEGWLRRIFEALSGRRAREGAEDAETASAARAETAERSAPVRNGRQRDGGTDSAFEGAQVRAGTAPATSATPAAVRHAQASSRSPERRQRVMREPGAGRELSLASIERHLRSIDRKVQKPKGESLLLRMVFGLMSMVPAVVEFIRQMRMDTHLDHIEDWTRKQYEVSHPFYAYARKRLRQIGEAEEADTSRKGGWLATLIAGTLGLLVAKLAGLLRGVPLIGSALTGLAKMLGGARFLPLAAGAARGGRAGAAAGVAGAATAARWGRAAEGVRGSRTARTARVAMRNVGRALRPAATVAKRVPVIGSLLALGLGVMDSSAIANDNTLTRQQKNTEQGRNWGSVGGGLGGAAIGAAIGTAILPGIGTAIGGVLGAVLGDWLGGDLGAMIGEKWDALMVPVAAAFNEAKLWAVATFDWVRDGATQFYTGAMGVFTGMGEWISDRWTAITDTVSSLFESVAGTLSNVLNGLKNIPVIGDAIRAAERAATVAAQAAANAAKAAADGAMSAGAYVADTTVTLAGKAWDGTKGALRAMVPQGIRDRVGYERALETAADYKAGNIKGLDDAHTRELVASTALTESSGGKLDTVNSAGYAGRYQAGAGWLADAGLIKGGSAAVTKAMQADGYTSEWKWGESGGMSRFLRNNANWNNGLSLNAYLGSAQLQDAAFKKNSDSAYDSLVRSGAITSKSTPEQIAGLLKARHIAGMGGALSVARGGGSVRDANGTSARDYYNDLVGPNAKFAGVFNRAAPAAPQTVAPPAAQIAAATAAPPASPTLTVPKAPAPAPLPTIPDAPAVHVPLGSGQPSKPLTVRMEQPDAGQDVRDRGIAHIATGGYARA